MFIKKLEESQMDKILEKLAGVLTAEDLQEIKESFESAVEERLKVKLAEETDSLTKKADEFCKQKIKEAVDKKTAELEDLANKYCEERCAKIALKEQEKLNSQCKKLEEAAEQYIYEFFDEKFTEKYGQELQALEEKVITGLDKYLEYNISEKINDKLITKTAMSETYAPIIEGIQHLFEDQYVPMDLTGSKKLREAKAENAELQKSLKKQLAENMRLIDLVEDSNKKATIAEKTYGLDPSQKARVQKFFESKSLSETKKDIDDYVDMISEQTEMYRTNRKALFEKKARPVSRAIKTEKALEKDELITEKYKKPSFETNTFMDKAARFLDEE